MKIYHTSIIDYSDPLILDNIKSSIYSIGAQSIRENYKIHVNFVNNSYIIDCESINSNIPSIKLLTYISKSAEAEVLRVQPKRLVQFPNSLLFTNYNACIDICNIYIDLMDFITALYDFEIEL